MFLIKAESCLRLTARVVSAPVSSRQMNSGTQCHRQDTGRKSSSSPEVVALRIQKPRHQPAAEGPENSRAATVIDSDIRGAVTMK